MTIPPKIRSEEKTQRETNPQLPCIVLWSRQFRGRLSNLCKFHFAFFSRLLLDMASCVIASVLIKNTWNTMRSDFAMWRADGHSSIAHWWGRRRRVIKIPSKFFPRKGKIMKTFTFVMWTWARKMMLSASENLKIKPKKCTQFASNVGELNDFSEHASYGLCCAQLELENQKAFCENSFINREQRR